MPTREPDARPAPRVSVIVPVHGDRGAILRTLTCLDAQTTAESFEVLVVDNGDNGDLAGRLSGRKVRVVTEERKGSYAARNTGVAASRGAVLAFTDADCLPRPAWLEQGVRALDRAGPGAFVGGGISMMPRDPRHLSWAEVWQVGHDLRQDRYVRNQGWAATANLFVRRADLRHVGEFQTELQSGGDKEWGTRATAAGVRGVFCADAAIDHPTRPTMAELMTKRRRVSRGSVDIARSQGVAVHPGGTLRALRPALRHTWRQATDLPISPLDRARLVAITAFLHVYQRSYEAALTGVHQRGSTPTG